MVARILLGDGASRAPLYGKRFGGGRSSRVFRSAPDHERPFVNAVAREDRCSRLLGESALVSSFSKRSELVPLLMVNAISVRCQ
jgi:hypothetical protein